MVRQYPDNQENILVGLNVFASILSFLGATFIITNYYIFNELRSFAFKLILCVAIGDMINCIGNFMGSPDNGALCIIQAIVIQFGDLTSFSWVTCVAWTIYTILTRDIPPTKDEADKWFIRMHIIIWPMVSILTIIPLALNVFGPAGGICWITGSIKGEIARWLSFYIPLWGSLAYMTFVYCRVWKDLNKTNNNKNSNTNVVHHHHNQQSSELDIGNPNIINNNDNKQLSTSNVNKHESDSNVFNTYASSAGGGGNNHGNTSTLNNVHESAEQNININSGGSVTNVNDNNNNNSGGMLQRIKYYPLILFICYLPATIRRLYELFSPGFPTTNVTPFFLSALTVVLSSLLGFGNAMLYGTTPQVYEKDKEYCCSNKKNARGSSNEENDDNEEIELGNDNRLR